MDPCLRAPHLGDDLESAKAKCHLSGDTTRYIRAGGNVGSRKLRREVVWHELRQIFDVTKVANFENFAKLAVDGSIATKSTASLRISDLYFGFGYENDVESEIGMIEKGRNAHELLKDAVERTAFWRLSRFRARAFHVALESNGMNQKDSMLGEQSIELLSHRPERRGLNLDEHVGPSNVRHESVNGHFELIAGPGVVLLERGMQRPFVEGSDSCR